MAVFARLRGDGPQSTVFRFAYAVPCVLRTRGGVGTEFSEMDAARRLAEDEDAASMGSDEDVENAVAGAAASTSAAEETASGISSGMEMLNASSCMPDHVSVRPAGMHSGGAPRSPTGAEVDEARGMLTLNAATNDDTVLEGARRASVIQELLSMGADIRRAGRHCTAAFPHLTLPWFLLLLTLGFSHGAEVAADSTPGATAEAALCWLMEHIDDHHLFEGPSGQEHASGGLARSRAKRTQRRRSSNTSPQGAMSLKRAVSRFKTYMGDFFSAQGHGPKVRPAGDDMRTPSPSAQPPLSASACAYR